MISHSPFFADLADLDPDQPRWRTTLAGLVVMRLVDAYREDYVQAIALEATTTNNALRLAAEISESDPSRAILSRIISCLATGTEFSSAIGEELIRYGRCLDLEGSWELAADVFATASESFLTQEDAGLVIRASTALGSAARSAGNWVMSDNAYAKAQHLADLIGDHEMSLTVRAGFAASARLRGNLPAAQAELEDVLAEARKRRFERIQSIALHELSCVAHSKGRYQDAVHLAYASLELTDSANARDRILADIAAGYAGLGMKQTARDGYSIVALTSPHQWVRWQATLNLVELAVDEGDETSFNKLLLQLESSKLDPRLAAYRLYFAALGFRKFGRENSDEMLESARKLASKHQLHQLAHEIEQSMLATAGRFTKKLELARLNPGESAELEQIAEALSHLRDDALAQTDSA